jgi:hypothetical protein
MLSIDCCVVVVVIFIVIAVLVILVIFVIVVFIVMVVVDDVLITHQIFKKNSSLWMSFWREPLLCQQKWRVDFSDKKHSEKTWREHSSDRQKIGGNN